MSNFDFDGVYSAVTGEPLHNRDNRELWAPEVLFAPAPEDIEIQGDGWYAVTGKTGQYSYNGAIMHPSEDAEDDTIREWVREADGDLFAIVEVRDDDGEYPDEPIGWTLVYRKAE